MAAFLPFLAYGADQAFNGGKGTAAVKDFAGKVAGGVPLQYSTTPSTTADRGLIDAFKQRMQGLQAPALDTRQSNAARAQLQTQLGQAGNQQRAAQRAFNQQFGQAQAGSQDALGMLRRQAAGAAPSAAELQMKQGLEAAIAAQASQAASARGVNPAQAAHMAAANVGQLQQQTAADTAQLRAQEQAQAQQAYAGAQGQLQGQLMNALQGQQGLGISAQGQRLGALGDIRGQDISSAGQTLESQLRTMGLQQGGETSALAASLGLSAEDRERQRRLDEAAWQQQNALYSGIRSGLLGAGGSLLQGALTAGMA